MNDPTLHSKKLNTRDAALVLGCSPNTLRLSRHTGTLFGRPTPAYLKLGRLVRYEEERLQQWLAQFDEQRNTAEGV
ncbi:hypothetical protein SAMN04487869_1042 [Marinobacter sp. DSM 26671]|uniref:helix-turn-helix transcriptional regulator n=1 Tax=Marinobacter sp. DSM 26671 TaxID=1761793 RepID=UPI0008F095B2|nr:hypothetical protein SAMN04487869_1042 [Marinobacter sp. DSM 26671]